MFLTVIRVLEMHQIKHLVTNEIFWAHFVGTQTGILVSKNALAMAQVIERNYLLRNKLLTGAILFGCFS